MDSINASYLAGLFDADGCATNYIQNKNQIPNTQKIKLNTAYPIPKTQYSIPNTQY